MSNPFPIGIPIVAGLAVACGFTFLSHGLWVGGKYSSLECRYSPSWAPDNPAFGIWGLIALSVIVSCLTQYAAYSASEDAWAAPEATALLAGGFFFASAWAPFFAYGQRRVIYYSVAAVLLVISAAFTLAAVVVERLVKTDENLLRWGLVEPCFGLTAGWVCVAASLSVGIAYRSATSSGECDEYEFPDKYNLFTDPVPGVPTTPVPLLLSLALGAASIAVSDPFLTIGPLVAVVYMPTSSLNWVAFVLLWGSMFASLLDLN